MQANCDPPPPAQAPARITFLYLGRTSAFGRFVLELTEAALKVREIEPLIAVSRANPTTPKIAAITGRILALDTFKEVTPFSVVTKFLSTRSQLLQRLKRDHPFAVVTLMPHIWTPLLAPSIRRLGIRYVSVVHDAVSHPGDPTAIVTPWLVREARRADLVVTLSRTVADRLVSAQLAPGDRVLSLFHPDITFGQPPPERIRRPGGPFRLLFFGRILPYKGLPLLIEAIEMLRAQSIVVELGVAGRGDISRYRTRLAALGTEVINRWIEEAEIPPLFARYDAMALSHIEASQSGVAAAAFGSGMPVIGTPVAGIAEQVIDGKTGLLARRLGGRAFADAVRRLALDPGLYQRIARHLRESAHERSMARFLDLLLADTLALASPRRQR
ncbi:MAG TPA: glycosyltransferase family 4 protein [Hyphomicrobiaceae bacterium]|nr:glycosyltransferase family 4 protein [Hyphomicrobiaceae bacterium]